jgi:ubiquinone biosynthesis protein
MAEAFYQSMILPRHLNRYREVAEVLARHGFGLIINQLDLQRRLNFPRLTALIDQSVPPGKTTAEHLRLAFEELGPTFIKLGQLMSTREDLLPVDYITELRRLQDEVPSFDIDTVCESIRLELGEMAQDILGTLEPLPLAAASLGQVHAAVLPDGQQVVVKVLRPNIEAVIEQDMDILFDLARLAQKHTPVGQFYNLPDLAEEFASRLWAELDYRREAYNAERFRKNFSNEEHLYIPLVYWDYCTRRVLVIERISGIKIDNVDALTAAGYDCHRIAEYSSHIILKEILEDGFFQADPHPGNLIVMPGEVIGAVDFGMVGHLGPAERAILIHILVNVVDQNAAGITEQLMKIGTSGHAIDQRALEREISRLLKKFYGLPLKDVRVAKVIEELFGICYRHRLRLPSDIVFLQRAIAMMEGVGSHLDPNLDLIGIAQPYAVRYKFQQWMPSEWGEVILQGVSSWGNLLLRFPGQTARLLEKVEQGNLGLKIWMPDLVRTTSMLDRIANRLSASLIAAALIIGLALLIPKLDLSWPWGWTDLFVLIGLVAINVVGLWLLWNIWRSK